MLGHLEGKPNDLERYIYLVGLLDRNETLFYRTVMSDPVRFVPILYDPTVADACLAFGHRPHPQGSGAQARQSAAEQFDERLKPQDTTHPLER